MPQRGNSRHAGIGWRQTLMTSPPNHILFFPVRAKKNNRLVENRLNRASVAQWSERSPFTSEVVDSILSDNILNVTRTVEPVLHTCENS